jgi:hypothetical protein
LRIEFGRIGTIGCPRDGGRFELLPVKKNSGDEINAAMDGRGDSNFLGPLLIPNVVPAGVLDIER